MKKLLLLLFSLMLSFNSYGEWVYINKNQDTGTSFYIETFTIEVDDGTVLWWDLNNYPEPQENGMLSSALKRAGDCNNKVFVNLGFKWFKNRMATGKNSGTFKPEHDWTKPVSGSIEEMMLNFACDYVGLPPPEIMTVISIDKGGQYYINSLLEANDMMPASLDYIINTMYARHQVFPERKVFINAHNDVAYQYVGQVINALIQIEGLEIDFLTQSHSREFSIKTELAEQEALEAKAKKIMEEASEKNQKIAEQEALKAKAKKIMAEVKRKAEEVKTKEAEILAKEAEILVKEAEILVKEETYVNNIAARIKTFWRYQAAEDDWSCEVYVVQDRQGQVKAVDVRNCNVGNSSLAKSFRNSIERAVYKASPLPAAPDEAVFDKEIIITFRVN